MNGGKVVCRISKEVVNVCLVNRLVLATHCSPFVIRQSLMGGVDNES